MQRRIAFLVLLILVASFLSPVSHAVAAPKLAGLPSGLTTAKVVGYDDGDKIVVMLSGNRASVNLIGEDAPESGECFAKDASDYIYKLLPKNTTVYLEKDKKDKDGKGRLLRYVWAANSKGNKAYLVNEWMLTKGYGAHVTKDGNVKYDTRLENAENSAKRNNRGLWGDCDSPHAKVIAPTAISFTTPTPKTPAPKKTFTPVTAPYSDEEQTYLNEVGSISKEVGGAVSDIGDRFQNPDIGNDDWTFHVAADFIAIRDGYQRALLLIPPAAFETEHGLFVQALSYANDASYDFETGITNYDAVSIQAGGEALTQSRIFIDQANAELDRIRKEREG